jgi:hypothetical protein
MNSPRSAHPSRRLDHPLDAVTVLAALRTGYLMPAIVRGLARLDVALLRAPLAGRPVTISRRI